MDRSSKVALGCGGFVIVASLAGALGYWSMVAGMDMTSDQEEVRVRSLAIVNLTPLSPLEPWFARRMARKEGADEGVIWAVDSQYQNLLLVARSAGAAPVSDAALLEALTTVHPSLAGFDPEITEPPGVVKVLGIERPVIVQSARTVDEGRQVRSCVAFPDGGRWVYLMLQGDPMDAGIDQLQRVANMVAPGFVNKDRTTRFQPTRMNWYR
jgi:hypothetical protein